MDRKLTLVGTQIHHCSPPSVDRRKLNVSDVFTCIGIGLTDDLMRVTRRSIIVGTATPRRLEIEWLDCALF